ncbi:hypothetical protein ACXR6G_18185 [Ancylomarina sp. YFZ004]
MPKSGIHIVKLRNTEALPINGNAEDAYVNCENIYVGFTINFESRRARFNSTFGKENVDFIPVVEMEKLDGRMTPILEALQENRMRSPRNNSPLRWLQGVNEAQLVKAILSSLNNQDDSYRVVYPKGK